jgi:uncharacterized protein YfcZ (UPF0381/DUF406 family)
MPKFIKNAMNQIIFPMVDKTDFASIESGITASDFNSAATKKFFGVNHGVSDAFTSGTISKAATLVHSGIFQQTLKAAECNYDYIVYRFAHASCADQILIFQTEELDLSDVISDLKSNLANRSALSDLSSDLKSYLAGMSGVLSDVYSLATLIASNVSDVESQVDLNASLASDAYSAAAQANSRALVIQSLVSDVDSQLLLNASMISDIDSQLNITASGVDDVKGMTSDLLSDVSDIKSYLVALSDLISNVDSALTSQYTAGHPLTASDLSDLRSAITGVTASVSASDMSDIASRVGVLLASDLSDILSAAQQGNSRALVIQSRLSDVESALDSQFVWTSATLSDMQSDLTSAIGNVSVALTASDISDIASAVAAAVTTITPSDISDIASAVYATLVSNLSDIYSAAQQTNSRALVIQSLVSDVDSQLLLNASMISDVQSALDSQFAIGQGLNASTMSDLRSAITATTFTLGASDISDIASRVYSVLASDLSDIYSAAVQTNSRALVNQSRVSDIYSLLSDVDSQLLLNASMISDIDSALDVVSGVISDVYSNLAAGVTIGASSLSDLYSQMWDTTTTEPTSVPAATVGRGRKLDWIYTRARNKTVTTSTALSLRNDDDSSDIASAAVTYDSGTSTFTQGEFA